MTHIDPKTSSPIRIVDLNEQLELTEAPTDNLLSVEDIINQYPNITSKPKTLKFDKSILTNALKAIKGQQDNIDLIVNKTFTWLRRPEKETPLVFMLAGTSGTGKTFTAETICNALQGYKMVKLNMNEYHNEGDTWKLLGSSPGYLGSNQEAPLFAAQRESDKLVILFDEIEKAHPSLFTTIMTLMEKGEMANGHGETVDFKQSIILFTTNLAMKPLLKLKQESINNNIDISSQEFQDATKKILKSANLREEISGRIQCVLVYNTLGVNIVAQIATENIRKLAKKYHLNINHISNKYLAQIANQCANSDEGARPVITMISNQLEPLFQDFSEQDNCNSEVLYDINDKLEIIPSTCSELASINDLVSGIEINNTNATNEPKGAFVLQLCTAPYFKDGYNYDDYRKAMGLIKLSNGSEGSAFIINPNGYLITCAHCVKNENNISFIKEDDKSQHAVRIVYCNELIDIAILKIEAANLPYLTITESNKPLKVGTEVVVLGYPSGTNISNDISSFEGKISSVDKTHRHYQSDVLAAPGSSGGAFISIQDGQVYGVLKGGYRETLNVEVSIAVNICCLFNQDDLNIEYI